MKSHIDQLQSKYDSTGQHLRAIEEAIIKQFSLPDSEREQVRKAVEAAYFVGRRTTTTDDWCDTF